MGKCKFGLGKDCKNRSTNVLLGACLIAIIAVGGLIATGGLSTSIYNQYNTNNYENPNATGDGTLDFQMGLPFIQGIYPFDDPAWGTITFFMYVDDLGNDVYRMQYNETVYTDVYECWFGTTDMELNRLMPSQQQLYLGEEIWINLLEITRIETPMDSGTYTQLSVLMVEGYYEIHIVINAWERWDAVGIPVGWLNIPLGPYPILVLPNQVNTYVLGQALADILLDMM